MLRGKLKVTMEFEIPVNEDMYPALQRVGGVTAEALIAEEEGNYLNHIDDYLVMLEDNVTEVSFDFEPSKERWDESSPAGS